MRKIEKEVADAYFRIRTRNIMIFLTIGFAVSFGVVAFAEYFSQFTFIGGVPVHYFMGAQGAVLVFIILLFTNAVLSDKVDRDFGIDEERNETLSEGKSFDH